MGLVEIIVLALVQGLTEFLPISSDGHLVLANAVLESLGYPPPPDLLAVSIVLHMGTLLSILVFFRREVWQLLGRDRRLIPLLIVGTIPAVVVGLPLKFYAEDMLESVLLAGFMFPVTGAMLIWGSSQSLGKTSYHDLGYAAAIKIGVLQSLALLPGVSRSGSTISGSLACGLDRESAGTFAFLLGIPAIAGAGALEFAQLIYEHMSATSAGVASPVTAAASPMALAVGALVAMIVGLFALAWLIRWVRQGRLALFAWYLFPLGAAVVGWQLMRP
jgi:undecaprenyl-diphosphatase